MFLDASAILAIVAREPDQAELSDKVARAATPMTSAIAAWEAVVGLMKKKQGMRAQDARTEISRFLEAAEVQFVEIGEAEREAALDAFDRFGKGGHPARLNMGDCFA